MPNDTNENNHSAIPKNEAEYASKTWDVLASVGIAVGTGIPLPPSIMKSLRKAADKFIQGATEYGMTYIDAATAKRKNIEVGKQLVLHSVAEAAAKKVTTDENLMERALNVFTTDLIGKQQNKENVLAIAVEELKNSKISDDSVTTIDEDWLGSFSTLAAQKSNKDVQQLLGKILAGEIRNPGTFSPLTLQILSTLTPPIAKVFEKFCNLCMTIQLDGHQDVKHAFLCHQPYPEYNQKGVPELGIGYGDLLTLQTYGLLTTKLDASYTTFSPLLEANVELGGRNLKLISKTGNPKQIYFYPVTPLSISGYELRSIISLEVPADHFAAQLQYFDQCGFDVTNL